MKILQIEPSSKNVPKTASDNPSWKLDNKSTKGEEIDPILAKAEVIPNAVVLKKSFQYMTAFDLKI